MATRQSGVRFIELGEEWRNAWISGIHLKELAKNATQNPQTVSRAIWLARIPDEIKKRIKAYPDIFNRQILLDTFAAKRRQCEKDSFKRLKEEVERLIIKGAGTKPNLKKTNKPIKNRSNKRTPNPLLDLKENPIYNIGDALNAELKIKKSTGTHCRVSFEKSGGGEIRIFFENKENLDQIIQNIFLVNKN